MGGFQASAQVSSSIIEVLKDFLVVFSRIYCAGWLEIRCGIVSPPVKPPAERSSAVFVRAVLRDLFSVMKSITIDKDELYNMGTLSSNQYFV